MNRTSEQIGTFNTADYNSWQNVLMMNNVQTATNLAETNFSKKGVTVTEKSENTIADFIMLFL